MYARVFDHIVIGRVLYALKNQRVQSKLLFEFELRKKRDGMQRVSLSCKIQVVKTSSENTHMHTHLVGGAQHPLHLWVCRCKHTCSELE